MLKQTEKRGQRAGEDFKTLSASWYKLQSYTKLRTTPGPPPENGQQHKLQEVLKYFQLSTNFTLGPDIIHNTKIHKQFSSRNGSLTQSMHYSDDIKIKLITLIKQRKVLLAKSTASQS